MCNKPVRYNLLDALKELKSFKLKIPRHINSNILKIL